MKLIDNVLLFAALLCVVAIAAAHASPNRAVPKKGSEPAFEFTFKTHPYSRNSQ